MDWENNCDSESGSIECVKQRVSKPKQASEHSIPRKKAHETIVLFDGERVRKDGKFEKSH
jgi:hypothetical protein